MDIIQCSKCKCNKSVEHFNDNENDNTQNLCNLQKCKKRHYEKHQEDINRKRREERACNGNIQCECGLSVKPENWDEQFSWMWHWSGLKRKLNEYSKKM